MKLSRKLDISRVDLNLFLVFDAIYREQNLTRASEALHLSQPAVSHALNRLREALSDPLFERSGRKMLPTPFAKSIVQRIRDGLDLFQTTVSQSLEFAPVDAQRVFTLACRDIIESRILPNLAKIIEQAATGIEMRSIRLDRKHFEAELIRGDIDCAVDILLPISDAIRHTLLSSESMAVVMSCDHPLAAKVKEQGVVTLTDYLACRHILVSSRAEGQSIEDVALAKIGEKRQVQLRCQDYFAASNIVSHTRLLATLPRSFALRMAHHDNNVIADLPFSTSEVSIYLYWRKHAEEDPGMRWFMNLFLQEMGQRVDS